MPWRSNREFSRHEGVWCLAGSLLDPTVSGGSAHLRQNFRNILGTILGPYGAYETMRPVIGTAFKLGRQYRQHLSVDNTLLQPIHCQ